MDYILKIVDLVQEQLGDQFTVEPQHVAKLNGTITGILIRPADAHSTTAPIFYPDRFGESVETAANRIVKTFRSMDPAGLETNNLETVLGNRSYMLDHAVLCVCNRDWNTEMLSSIPHQDISGTDLSSYVRVVLSDEASFKPGHAQLHHLNISEDELFASAYDNHRKNGYSIAPLSDILGYEEQSQDIYVLHTNQGYNGTGSAVITLPEALDKAAEMIGSKSIYILPSSIHECLAVSTDNMSVDELESMVQAINQSQVATEERLSDHVYLYDGKDLMMAKDLQQDISQETPQHRRSR